MAPGELKRRSLFLQQGPVVGLQSQSSIQSLHRLIQTLTLHGFTSQDQGDQGIDVRLLAHGHCIDAVLCGRRLDHRHQHHGFRQIVGADDPFRLGALFHLRIGRRSAVEGASQRRQMAVQSHEAAGLNVTQGAFGQFQIALFLPRQFAGDDIDRHLRARRLECSLAPCGRHRRSGGRRLRHQDHCQGQRPAGRNGSDLHSAIPPRLGAYHVTNYSVTL
ncbi:hypothetical protein D3C86_1417020 [compost metagenome]